MKIIRSLRRTAIVANWISLIVGTVLTAGYIGLISFEVFARYVFHASQSWTFELATYLFVISVFLGSATGCWERTHLSIIEVSGKTVLQRLHRLVIDLICVAISIIVVKYGYEYAIAGFGRVSPSMGFKMALVYAWVPMAFALSMFFIVVRWFGETV